MDKSKLTGSLKRLLPYFLILVAFYLISVIYMWPSTEGKVLYQFDVLSWKAGAHEVVQLKENTGHISAWTNSMFGGMPTYQVSLPGKNSIYGHLIYGKIYSGLIHNRLVRYMFMYFLGFFIMLIVLKIDKWVSFLVSLAFGLSSYNLIIIAAGHNTKAEAIGFMALVMAGLFLIFERKKLFGGALLFMLALGLQIKTGHIQIIYYTAITAGIYMVYKVIMVIKNKSETKSFLLGLVFALFAALLAVLPNIATLWEGYEMGKYSIRGKSELSDNKKKANGLDKDYALAWSYGVEESLSIMIPNIKGGETDYLGNNKIFKEKYNSDYKQYLAQQNQYWGNQPFTSGPVYFGAIIMFLFVLGLFIVDNPFKWWILAAAVLSVMLSWGKNFMPLTNLFFDYFPYYNKFRTVSMILVIANLVVPILSAMALDKLVKEPDYLKKNFRKGLIAFGLTGGIALIFAIFPGLFSTLSNMEKQQFDQVIAQNPANAQQWNAFIAELQNARKMIVSADAWRSFLFILLAYGALLYYTFLAKANKYLLYGSVGLLILIDMWSVGTRYLSYNDFQFKNKVDNQLKPKPVDQFIMKDQDPDFRVLNLTANTFSDPFTSYFHKSIGGYHGAKLRRYQDLIDYYLAPYNNMLISALKDSTVDVFSVLKPMQVLHMLNTKYIIVDPNAMPIVNTYAYGHAWFVDGYKFVNSPKEEIKALSQVDLSRYAVIDKSKFGNYDYPQLSLNPDTLRAIDLVYYRPDSLVYKSFSRKDEFAVFSEIYYPEGWQVYIDGKPSKLVRADYVLRAMSIPAGEHTITMVFKPASYYTARKIALVSSIIAGLLLVLGTVYIIYSSYKKEQ